MALTPEGAEGRQLSTGGTRHHRGQRGQREETVLSRRWQWRSEGRPGDGGSETEEGPRGQGGVACAPQVFLRLPGAGTGGIGGPGQTELTASCRAVRTRGGRGDPPSRDKHVTLWGREDPGRGAGLAAPSKVDFLGPPHPFSDGPCLLTRRPFRVEVGVCFFVGLNGEEIPFSSLF